MPSGNQTANRMLAMNPTDMVYRFTFPSMEFNNTQGRMIPPWQQQRIMDPQGYIFDGHPDLNVQQQQMQLELERRQKAELRRILGF